MKILCPIDFSSASINGCGWAARLLEQTGGGELVLLHCINVVSRSALFIKMDDVFREQAENDFKTLLPQLKQLAPSISISAKIANQDPKIYILSFLKGQSFDLIVTGTKGLSALKEMTVGSTTAFLMDHSPVPLIAIPDEYKFKGVQSIVVGLDEKASYTDVLIPVLQLARRSGAEITFVNTTTDLEDTELASIQLPIDGISNQVLSIRMDGSIPKTLTKYCLEQEADLLVMVHRKRPWLERLFKTSLTKEELFEIKTPLFILPTGN